MVLSPTLPSKISFVKHCESYGISSKINSPYFFLQYSKYFDVIRIGRVTKQNRQTSNTYLVPNIYLYLYISYLAMYVYGVGSFVCCAKLFQSCLTLLPYGPYPTRVVCQWDFPGKNTGVGCHSRGSS